MSKPRMCRAERQDGKGYVKGWYAVEDWKTPKQHFIINMGRRYDVIPDSVAQSTGREDKNGGEVFGEMKVQRDKGSYIYDVMWDDQQGMWRIVPKENRRAWQHVGFVEVCEILPDKEPEDG